MQCTRITKRPIKIVLLKRGVNGAGCLPFKLKTTNDRHWRLHGNASSWIIFKLMEKRQRHQHQQQDHKCFDRKCTFHRYCGMKINKRVKHFMNKFTKLNIKRWFTDPFSCINIIRFHCKNEIAKEEKHQRSTLRKHENLIILREVEKGKLH